jgi:hypothetical protein
MEGNAYNFDELARVKAGMVPTPIDEEARSWDVASTYGFFVVDNQLRQLCLVLP